ESVAGEANATRIPVGQHANQQISERSQAAAPRSGRHEYRDLAFVLAGRGPPAGRTVWKRRGVFFQTIPSPLKNTALAEVQGSEVFAPASAPFFYPGTNTCAA